MRFRAFLLIASLVPTAAMAQSISRTYVGPDNGNWSDPNNWSPAGVPIGTDSGSALRNADNATVSGVVSVTFDFDYPPNLLRFVTIQANATYYQSAGTLAALSIDMDATGYQSGGTVYGFNGVTLGGSYTLSGNGSVRTTGPSDIYINGTLNESGGSIGGMNGLQLHGILNISGGSIGGDYFQAYAGSFVNQTGGIVSGADSGIQIGSAGDAVTSYHADGGEIYSESSISILGRTNFYQNGGYIDCGLEGGNGFEIGTSTGDQVQYILTAGQIDADYDSVDLGNVNFIQSGGSISAPGYGIGIHPAAVYTFSGGQIDVGSFSNYGTFDQSGGNIEIVREFSVSGQFTLDGAGSISSGFGGETINGKFFQTGGTNTLGQSPHAWLTIAEGGTYFFSSGSLSAEQLVNQGRFIFDGHSNTPSPGMAIPYFNQDSTGQLSLLDLLPSGDPLLTFSTSATLDGSLQITLDLTYTPEIGDVFSLIQSPSLTGMFAKFDFPLLANGLDFEPIYSATELKLAIVPEPAAECILIALPMVIFTRRLRKHI